MEYEEENVSNVLTCIQQTFTDNYTSEFLSPSVATATAVLQSLYQIITLPPVLILNALVIVVISKNKKLQTAPYFTALQVVCFNFVIALSTTLSTISSAIKGRWVLGEYLCIFTATLSFMLGLTRSFLMAILAIDRSLYVFTPNSYHKAYKIVVLGLTIPSYLIALLGSIFPIPGILDCYGYEPVNQVCYVATSCNTLCGQYLFIFFVLGFFPACIVPAILYSSMCCKAKALKKHSSSTETKSYFYNKATLTFFFLFLSTIVLTLPLSILTFLVQITTNSEVATNVISVISSMAVKSTAITDPLFLLRNDAAKITLRSMANGAVKSWRSTVVIRATPKSDED